MSRQDTSTKQMDLTVLRSKVEKRMGPLYWKSLQELSETEEFQEFIEKEFPATKGDWTDPLGRRRFLQLMGASLALAGLGACTRQPEERLVPYVRAPEQVIPGKPLFFATSMPFWGYGQGLLVESHDGRPTKVEGNPKHPASLGASDIFGQASLLDLYDPDRPEVILNRGRVRSWGAFTAALNNQIEESRLNRGKGLRILTGTVTSPTLSHQFEELLLALPEARWHQYEPVNIDGARAGGKLAFGTSVNTFYRFDKADVVLSLDSDFLFMGPAAVRYAKDFSTRRRIASAQPSMSRLYAVESTPTITAAMADHQIQLRASDIEGFSRLIAAKLGLEVPNSATFEPHLDQLADKIVADLKLHRGSSVVVPGEFQPANVHALAHAINHALGNTGHTVILTEPIEAQPISHLESIKSLTQDMASGKVDTLLIIGGNPVYDTPSDLDFEGALERVEFTAHLTLHSNETSRRCEWAIPESHYLEAWSDVRAFDGTASIIQPLILPLYQSKSAHELLAVLEGRSESSGYEMVRNYWRTYQPGPFEKWWRLNLHEGFIKGTSFPEKSVSVDALAIRDLKQPVQPDLQTLEVVFRPDPSIFDGRFSNNGWLQELPKALTKLTWDNAVLIGPATAERLQLDSGDLVEVSHGDRVISGPVWIQPGHSSSSITLHLGYGRRHVGRVGSGTGFDVNPLRRTDSFWWEAGVQLKRVGGHQPLACTQDHHSMEDRDLIRTVTLDDFLNNSPTVHEGDHEPGESSMLYPAFEYKGHAWGMAVDLSACTGCNACVIACQAENNIAVVGKEQVLNGREMHWIRIDRYYSDSLDRPSTSHQPVMCQQCENAPCESVCPVAATVHSDEGLNDMVYNRCVGTRYCSNNCPYKVRRFNYHLYSDWQTESLKPLRNPNVSVRSRGVMEKCTYCVQRINAAKIQAKLEERPLQDGEIQTACQQVCPAEAIVFGDLNDRESRVSKLKSSPRNYGILTELRTVPRTSYLTKVKNPNKEVESA